MNADQRLDQLEPLVAESIAVLDRHTAQLIRLNNNVNQLIELATQQSSNINFLLEENVKTNARLTQLEKDVTGLKADVAELKADVAELKQGQLILNNKLDLILSKLG